MNEGTVRRGMGATPAVALVNPKFEHNVGAALRAASCFGAKQLWWSGPRVSFDGETRKGRRIPREERMKGYREVEAFHADYFLDAFTDAVPVAIELHPGAESLLTFEHPERAVYLFGPEDGSIDRSYRGLCHRIVKIPSRHCLNLAAAVYTVLYDRHVKRVLQGLEEPLDLAEERGFDEPDSMRGLL